jgi:hypothetical protein
MPQPKVQLPPDTARMVQLTNAKALQLTNSHANTRDQIEIFPVSFEEIIVTTHPQ